ncbi:hypothetical protein BDA96_01G237000 [Sorghum bicolor]|uniref:Uncharacterized protein n=2 Tax=Sorghum bicolor TaxID=4558 RepID=A0A921S0E7_SORBI|nr:hypothetical protein BDA96_01G237000 [Sorghum bicolor]OQU91657.1 hypothetical protein SORBI_3001G222250 [Sorghum bicolor]
MGPWWRRPLARSPAAAARHPPVRDPARRVRQAPRQPHAHLVRRHRPHVWDLARHHRPALCEGREWRGQAPWRRRPEERRRRRARGWLALLGRSAVCGYWLRHRRTHGQSSHRQESSSQEIRV